MTPRPQPRKPDALDLAEMLASEGLYIREAASRILSATEPTIRERAIEDAREAAQRVLAAIDEYEGRT